MIKLIATDIDETILPAGQHHLNPEYFNVIRSLLNRGIQFCVASGRQYGSQSRLFDAIKSDIFFMTENGAQLLDGKRAVFYQVMTLEDSRQLVLDTRAIEGAQSLYCTSKVTYFEPKDQEAYEMMKNEYHFNCQMVEDLLKLKEPCLKYSLYLRERIGEITEKEFCPKWKKTHDVTRGGNHFVSVMAPGVNKGRALEELQKYLEVTKEETLVFGDNMNDLEMFDAAGISIAVDNAKSPVKKRASMITRSDKEDGVLQILKEILENKKPWV